MSKKKVVIVVLVIALAISLLSGCFKPQENPENNRIQEEITGVFSGMVDVNGLTFSGVKVTDSTIEISFLTDIKTHETDLQELYKEIVVGEIAEFVEGIAREYHRDTNVVFYCNDGRTVIDSVFRRA